MDLTERGARYPTSTRFFLRHSLACGRKARATGERRDVPPALRPFSEAWLEGYDADPAPLAVAASGDAAGAVAEPAAEPAGTPAAESAAAFAAPSRKGAPKASRKAAKAAEASTGDLFGAPPPTPATAKPAPGRRRKVAAPGA